MSSWVMNTRIWPTHRKQRVSRPEYDAWMNMNALCSPSARDKRHYFDKGIAVCDEWKSHGRDRSKNKIAFASFKAHLGDKPFGSCLGRIDKSKGFEPSNCRWMENGDHQSNKSRPKKYSYSTDEQLIEELERRGYTVTHG